MRTWANQHPTNQSNIQSDGKQVIGIQPIGIQSASNRHPFDQSIHPIIQRPTDQSPYGPEPIDRLAV
jgi:hypothetical protein